MNLVNDGLRIIHLVTARSRNRSGLARPASEQNRRLHSAWQTAVREVKINTELLSASDIKILRKLVNLERLVFEGLSSPQHVALWHIVSSVAPVLSSLTSLIFDSVAGGFGILRTVAGLQQLATNLRRLRVSSCHQSARHRGPLGTDEPQGAA
jgi:hypothetical protein